MLSSNRKSSLGVAIPELALVIPVLIILVFGGIDISRYYWVKRQLDYAAFSALTVASTDPGFYIDITPGFYADEHGPAGDTHALAVYENSYVKIATTGASRGLFSVVGVPGSGQVAELLEYSHPILDFSAHPNWVRSFAVLRPFECMHKNDSTDPTGCDEGDPECFRHPAFLNRAGYPCPGTVLGIERYMRSEPILVEVRARLQLFTPLIEYLNGPTIVAGTALGFREDLPKGGLIATLGGSATTTTTTTSTLSSTTLTTVTTTTGPPTCSPLPNYGIKMAFCVSTGAILDPNTPDDISDPAGDCKCVPPEERSL